MNSLYKEGKMQRFLMVVLIICGLIALLIGALLIVLSLPSFQYLRTYLPQDWDVNLCALGVATLFIAATWLRDTGRR
jgi:hypothetical protein